MKTVKMIVTVEFPDDVQKKAMNLDFDPNDPESVAKFMRLNLEADRDVSGQFSANTCFSVKPYEEPAADQSIVDDIYNVLDNYGKDYTFTEDELKAVVKSVQQYDYSDYNDFIKEEIETLTNCSFDEEE